MLGSITKAAGREQPLRVTLNVPRSTRLFTSTKGDIVSICVYIVFLRCANMLLLDKARQTRFKMGTDKFLVAFRVVHSPRNHVILFAGTFLVA